MDLKFVIMILTAALLAVATVGLLWSLIDPLIEDLRFKRRIDKFNREKNPAAKKRELQDKLIIYSAEFCRISETAPLAADLLLRSICDIRAEISKVEKEINKIKKT